MLIFVCSKCGMIYDSSMGSYYVNNDIPCITPDCKGVIFKTSLLTYPSVKILLDKGYMDATCDMRHFSLESYNTMLMLAKCPVNHDNNPNLPEGWEIIYNIPGSKKVVVAAPIRYHEVGRIQVEECTGGYTFEELKNMMCLLQ